MTKWTRPEKKKLTRPQIPPHPLDWWLLRRIYYFNATHLAQRWRWFILSLLSRSTPPSITLQSSRVLVLSLLSPFWLVSSRSLIKWINRIFIKWMNRIFIEWRNEWIIHSLSTLSHPFFQLQWNRIFLNLFVTRQQNNFSSLAPQQQAVGTRNDGSRESADQQTLKIHHQRLIMVSSSWRR